MPGLLKVAAVHIKTFSASMPRSHHKKSPRRDVGKLFSVFVGHIPLSVQEEDLQTIFEGAGKVEDMFILPATKHMEFTYGFVRYATAEEATKAVKDLNYWPVHGMKLRVQIAKDTSSLIPASAGGTSDSVSINAQRLVKCLTKLLSGAPLDLPAGLGDCNPSGPVDIQHLCDSLHKIDPHQKEPSVIVHPGPWQACDLDELDDLIQRSKSEGLSRQPSSAAGKTDLQYMQCRKTLKDKVTSPNTQTKDFQKHCEFTMSPSRDTLTSPDTLKEVVDRSPPRKLVPSQDKVPSPHAQSKESQKGLNDKVSLSEEKLQSPETAIQVSQVGYKYKKSPMEALRQVIMSSEKQGGVSGRYPSTPLMVLDTQAKAHTNTGASSGSGQVNSLSPGPGTNTETDTRSINVSLNNLSLVVSPESENDENTSRARDTGSIDISMVIERQSDVGVKSSPFTSPETKTGTDSEGTERCGSSTPTLPYREVQSARSPKGTNNISPGSGVSIGRGTCRAVSLTRTTPPRLPAVGRGRGRGQLLQSIINQQRPV